MKATGKQPECETAVLAVAASKDGEDSSLWDLTEAEELERIREYWLGLDNVQRRNLAKVHKDCMWKNLEQQQKQECVCRDCRRKKRKELKASFEAFCRQLELDERRRWHGKASRCLSKALIAKGRYITVDDSVMKDEGVYFWDDMELLSKLPCTFQCEPTPPSDCSARNVGDEEKQASPSGSAQERPVDDGDDCSLEILQEHCTICPAVFYHLAAEMLQDCVVGAYRERLALERQERLIWEFEEQERLAAERRKSVRLEKKQKRREKTLNKPKSGEGAERQHQDEESSGDRRSEAEQQQNSLQMAKRKKKKRSRKKKKKSCRAVPNGEPDMEVSVSEDLDVLQDRSIVPSQHCDSTVARTPCHYTGASALPGHCHHAVPNVFSYHHTVPRVQSCHRTGPGVHPCHLTVPRVKPYYHVVPRKQACHSDVARQYPCHSSTMVSFRYMGNECALSNCGRPDVTFDSERAHEVEQALAKMIDDLLA